MGLTQGCFVADSIAQKVPRTHSGQLRKTFHEPFRLCSFTDARRTDQNDASGAFELLSGHSNAICRYAERTSTVGGLLEGGPDLRRCLWQREKLEASGRYILQPHDEIVKRHVPMYKERNRSATV